VVEVVRQATKTTATTVYVRDNVIVVIGVGVVVVTRREIAKRVDRVIIIVVERELVEDVRLRLI
jgi:3-hydroxyisobutyrate dehydrogenase-like beta-hydroxyacid dehydrogenase